MKTILLNLLFAAVFLLSGCSGQQKQQIVRFEGTYPETKWAIGDLNPEIPSDWSSSGYFTFEINSSTTQRFELRLYDSDGVRKLEILPFQGVWIRASIPLIHFQKMNTEGMDQASIWKTPRPGYWIGFTGSVGTINDIDSIGVAMQFPIGSPQIVLRNVRLTKEPCDSILTGTPLVDEFGQWIPSDYPGKARSAEELERSWREEESTLSSVRPEATKYGGFPGKRYQPTGFFRTMKINGIWWFIDPEGFLFFSNGSNCIEPSSNLARVKGREYIFSKLPPSDLLNDSANHHGDNTTSFYTWNLHRRFGDEWYPRWKELTFNRMDSWGINTIGNWSDPDLGRGQRKTYVATLQGWEIENGIMGMPDVYDPGYTSRVDSMASLQCAPRKDDPFLLGYFIGNEPPWPGRENELADLILSGNETPMQKELKKFLTPVDSPERRKEFIYQTYQKFLNTVCPAIKRYDPNHLNLGFRLGGENPDEMIAISKDFFDVFSINIYDYSAKSQMVNRINMLTGLPVIIGEFHFGVPAMGLAPGLAQTINLEERAVAYQYYVENAAANPAIIGTHWFQWIDQPTTGRFDGENYNIGFVDVTDRPYADMIKASREIFTRLPGIHSGSTQPTDRKALIQ